MTLRPRGIRNNNPGNIEYNGTKWRGLKTPPSDGRFCVFVAPEWGIRALAIVLRNYQRKYRINTIRGAITRFAPSTENNTAAYVASVAHAMEVDADEPLDWCANKDILTAMVKAIIQHENGIQPYKITDIEKGICL